MYGSKDVVSRLFQNQPNKKLFWFSFLGKFHAQSVSCAYIGRFWPIVYYDCIFQGWLRIGDMFVNLKHWIAPGMVSAELQCPLKESSESCNTTRAGRIWEACGTYRPHGMNPREAAYKLKWTITADEPRKCSLELDHQEDILQKKLHGYEQAVRVRKWHLRRWVRVKPWPISSSTGAWEMHINFTPSDLAAVSAGALRGAVLTHGGTV